MNISYIAVNILFTVDVGIMNFNPLIFAALYTNICNRIVIFHRKLLHIILLLYLKIFLQLNQYSQFTNKEIGLIKYLWSNFFQYIAFDYIHECFLSTILLRYTKSIVFCQYSFKCEDDGMTHLKNTHRRIRTLKYGINEKQ